MAGPKRNFTIVGQGPKNYWIMSNLGSRDVDLYLSTWYKVILFGPFHKCSLHLVLFFFFVGELHLVLYTLLSTLFMLSNI